MVGDGDKTAFLEGAFRRLQIVAPLLAIAVGACLSLLHSHFLAGMGAGIVAAGVIALLAFLTFGDLLGQRRQAQLDEQTAALKEVSASCQRLETRKKRDEVATRVGLDECYERRPDPAIEEAVLQATKTVDILEVSMETMRELDSSDWLGCEAEVRIILLDPLFPEGPRTLANLRDEEEEQGPDAILGEIRKVLRTLPEAWMGNGEDESESRVRLARVMPTMSYFRIDDVAYFAPLVYRKLGNRTMHMRFREHGDFFDVLAENFEKLWKDTKHVRPAVPEKLMGKSSQVGPSEPAEVEDVLGT